MGTTCTKRSPPGACLAGIGPSAHRDRVHAVPACSAEDSGLIGKFTHSRSLLIKVLPLLILAARRAVMLPGDEDRREAHRLLAETYHLAQAWLAWHGDRELVWMSADRAYSAAQAADDPVAMARAS